MNTTTNSKDTKMNDNEQARVMMWTTPRANSTVLTKCLSFVPGSQIYMEPYYYCYHALLRIRSLGRRVDPMSITTYDDIDDHEWMNVVEMMSPGEKCAGKVHRDMIK